MLHSATQYVHIYLPFLFCAINSKLKKDKSMKLRNVFVVLLIYCFSFSCNPPKEIRETTKVESTFLIPNNDFGYKPPTLDDSLSKLPIQTYSLEEIKQLFLFVKDKDQEARIKYQKLYNKEGWAARDKVDFSENDVACRNIFDRLILQVGFPDNKRFGKEIDSVVFLILAHAPHSDYQLKYINQWEKAVEQGVSNPQLFADIKDRTLIWEKDCQKYGTQRVKRQGIDKDSIYLKICDIAKLNEERKKIGLHSLDTSKIKQLVRFR